jgi:hypothetical protein
MNQQNLIHYLDEILKETRKSTTTILLTGPWGCGKTFAIEQVFSKYDLKLFYNISMFGLTNIDSIFDEITLAILGKETKISTTKKTKQPVEAVLDIARKKFKTIGEISQVVQKAFIDSRLKNDVYIIIDDLERKSKNISSRDILGCIEALREKCNVIAIGNIEKIIDEDGVDFNEYKERVFDRMYSIDEVDELIIQKVALERKNSRIDEEVIKKLIEYYYGIKESNLRTLIRIIDELNDLSTNENANEILASVECIVSIASLVIQKHSYAEKIEELAADKYSSDEKSKYSVFRRKYNLPGKMGFDIEPFIQYVEHRKYDLVAMLSAVGIIRQNELGKAFKIVTRYWCFTSDVVIEAMEKLISAINSDNIYLFDLSEVVHFAYCSSLALKIMGFDEKNKSIQDQILSRIEKRCQVEKSQQISSEAERILMSFNEVKERNICDTIVEKLRLIAKYKETEELLIEFDAFYVNGKYYKAMRIFALDYFNHEARIAFIDDLLKNEIPEEFYFAIGNILKDNPKSVSSVFLKKNLVNKTKIYDPLVKDRISVILKLVETTEIV